MKKKAVSSVSVFVCSYLDSVKFGMIVSAVSDQLEIDLILREWNTTNKILLHTTTMRERLESAKLYTHVRVEEDLAYI